MTEATGKLARCRLRLLKFDLYIVHCAAVKHQSVDALSRFKTGGTDKKALEDQIHVRAFLARDKPKT